MSIDLSKLTPAPWFVNSRTGLVCHGDPSDDRENYPIDEPEDDEFIALARNAFDVMMRRGWGPVIMPNGWSVKDFARKQLDDDVRRFRVWAFNHEFPDPFTALVEADKWMCEQEKANA